MIWHSCTAKSINSIAFPISFTTVNYALLCNIFVSTKEFANTVQVHIKAKTTSDITWTGTSDYNRQYIAIGY